MAAQNLPPTPRINKNRNASRKSNTPRRNVKFLQADEPRLTRIRRKIFRFLTHPGFFVPVIVLTVGTVLTLGYYWSVFSERIDLLLNGEVFTRSAGIYAAPKTLRDGEQLTQNNLVAYLKGANYVDRNQAASKTRGRFKIDGNAVEIEPGDDSKVDGKQPFAPLRVKFNKDGKAVASIQNIATSEELKSAPLEPKLLSAVLGEDRERRKTVTFGDLPPVLVKAITTTEDRAFFEHYGVNIRGVLRALWRRVDTEDGSPIARQGGSSITQQLVKNLLLSPEKSWTRKIQEAYMSVILETRLSKEKIFELYANQIYLGQQAGFSINGVGEAANAYFGKDVTALNLAESAFLAGIIRSPNRYNPYKNLEKVTERRNQVLDTMVQAEVITKAEADAAKQMPLVLVQAQKREELTDTPYFTEYAQSQLQTIVADPEAVQHLRVYTTLDADLQRAAQDVIQKRLARLDKIFPKKPAGSLNAALVAIRPKTGEIVAMIGGRDYLENQFNRATDAQRQPGSVFKPFVYAAAINTAYDPTPRTITAATTFEDKAKVFTYGNETYKPNNYGDFFSNKEITVRDALVKSKNVITVDLAMELNIGKVMKLAERAGLPKVPKAYPAMALGTSEATPLQMASAYTTFANLGSRSAPLAVSRVTTGEGTTVAAPITQKNEVLRPDVAYIMNDMMKDVVNRGTAAELRAWGMKNVAGKTAFAGKTGTSRDGWFAGFTPELVCVVYVGFDDGGDLGMKGSDSAMPIWADFMKAALDAHPEWNGDWQMPGGIEKVEIDANTGKVIADKETTETTTTAQTTVTTDANGNSVLVSKPDGSTAVAAPIENRRTELFISGTIPRGIIAETEPAELEPEVFPQGTSEPEATPMTSEEMRDTMRPNPTTELPSSSGSRQPQPTPTPRRPGATVMLQICDKTGYIASPSCPTMRAKSFQMGTETREFCGAKFHPR